MPSARALTTPHNRPNSWHPCLPGGAVIGGEISSIEQVMHWLAPTPQFERLRRVRRALESSSRPPEVAKLRD
jgi:hypothetical protein